MKRKTTDLSPFPLLQAQHEFNQFIIFNHHNHNYHYCHCHLPYYYHPHYYYHYYFVLFIFIIMNVTKLIKIFEKLIKIFFIIYKTT